MSERSHRPKQSQKRPATPTRAKQQVRQGETTTTTKPPPTEDDRGFSTNSTRSGEQAHLNLRDSPTPWLDGFESSQTMFA